MNIDAPECCGGCALGVLRQKKSLTPSNNPQWLEKTGKINNNHQLRGMLFDQRLGFCVHLFVQNSG